MRAVTKVEIRPVAASGESGHKRGDPTCRASGESGHKRGDPTCSGERAVNNQPMGRQSGRAAGEVEQNHSAERNQPSNTPDTWSRFNRAVITPITPS